MSISRTASASTSRGSFGYKDGGIGRESVNIREGILYSLVARNTAVLAKYGRCAGNFTEVSELVLARITPANPKLTYDHGSFLFHYISDGGLIFLCITDSNFQRNVAFAFLDEIKNIFYRYYGSLGLTAMPYSMNTEFGAVLQTQMKRFSEPTARSSDRLMQVARQTEEVKQIMVQTIDSIAARGENMELLVEKTMELSYDAVNFDHRSKSVKRKMLHKNIKMSVALGLLLIVVIYLIASLICGFDFHKCS